MLLLTLGMKYGQDISLHHKVTQEKEKHLSYVNISANKEGTSTLIHPTTVVSLGKFLQILLSLMLYHIPELSLYQPHPNVPLFHIITHIYL